MIQGSLLQDFQRAVASPDEGDLAGAALLIARLEYPRLDPRPYLARLDAMGAAASERLSRIAAQEGTHARVAALNRYLFDEQGFAGNREHYDDPRNSLLNEVLDRRTGIPITLALVYLEVARRAGLQADGVNFPGHFLLRCPVDPSDRGPAQDLIVDPFHGGALLEEADCRELLRAHVGEEASFDRSLLAPATKRQILVRMLVNLKRVYIRLRSFPQARDVTDMLLAADPDAATERRDRGLLAYHLKDYSAALRDLEAYLQLTPRGEADEETHEEHAQIWEHVKALRRRVASLN